MTRWGFVLLAIALPAHADLEPGNWELTGRSEAQGADAKGFTQTQCLTAADAADPGRLFGGRGTPCEFVNRRDTGSLITFDISCATQPPVRGSGSVRYARDSLEGDLELNLEGFATRSHISGRRLGGC